MLIILYQQQNLHPVRFNNQWKSQTAVNKKMEARCNGIYFCPKNWMFHIGQCVSHQRDEGRVVFFFSPFIGFLFFGNHNFQFLPKRPLHQAASLCQTKWRSSSLSPPPAGCAVFTAEYRRTARHWATRCLNTSARAWISVCREAPFYKNVCIGYLLKRSKFVFSPPEASHVLFLFIVFVPSIFVV